MKITILIAFIVCVIALFGYLFSQFLLPPSGSEHQVGVDYLRSLRKEIDLNKAFDDQHVEVLGSEVVTTARRISVIIYFDRKCEATDEFKEKMAALKMKLRISKPLYLEFYQGKPGSDEGEFLRTRIQ